MPQNNNPPSFDVGLGLVSANVTLMFHIWPNLTPYLNPLKVTRMFFNLEIIPGRILQKVITKGMASDHRATLVVILALNWHLPK